MMSFTYLMREAARESNFSSTLDNRSVVLITSLMKTDGKENLFMAEFNTLFNCQSFLVCPARRATLRQMKAMSWIRQRNDGSLEIAERIFGGIIPLLLIIVGTIGNSLCVFYLFQRIYRRTPSTNVYLIFLFVSDTVSLYQWNLNYIVMEFGAGKQLSNQSLFLCRSIAFLSFYTVHLSALFLCLVAIDRTLILWSRAYRVNMAKRRRASIISMILAILVFALDGFLLSLGFIDADTKQVVCYDSSNRNLMMFFTDIYPWIHLVGMYIVPLIIMIVGIILIIIKVYTRRSHARHLGHKQRLSLMLVCMCVVYMMLTLPNRLCFSVFLSTILNHVYTDTVLLSSNTLLYTRSATNICFLYVSSATFRKQLAKLLCINMSCCRWSRSNRVVPVQHMRMMQRRNGIHTLAWRNCPSSEDFRQPSSTRTSRNVISLFSSE